MVKVIEWIATCLSITGASLNAFHLKEGFYVWILANILWIVFGIKTKHYGVVVMFIVYSIISAIGILVW